MGPLYFARHERFSTSLPRWTIACAHGCLTVRTRSDKSALVLFFGETGWYPCLFRNSSDDRTSQERLSSESDRSYTGRRQPSWYRAGPLRMERVRPCDATSTIEPHGRQASAVDLPLSPSGRYLLPCDTLSNID